jgi:O-methyltransferase involved in polyketide biosynthesis
VSPATRQSVRLGAVPETLLVPLFARAVESCRPHPILDDPLAAQMVASIDWDYQRFNQRWRTAACALRSRMFDNWVRDFLGRSPEGTVVEIGSGLNTRFERLDNGRVHWFDLDLPEVIELRARFFTDSERRTTLAASVASPDWIAAVRRSPAPYLFVAETVLVYLPEAEVRLALALIARNFPSAQIAFDTIDRKALERGNGDMARRKMAARFAWACEDPCEIENWDLGLRRLEYRTLLDLSEPLLPRLSWPLRATFRACRRCFPRSMKSYQLNLFGA